MKAVIYFLDSGFPKRLKSWIGNIWTAKVFGGFFFVCLDWCFSNNIGGSIIWSHTYLEGAHKIFWTFLALSLPFKKATCPNMFSSIHFEKRMLLLG